MFDRIAQSIHYQSIPTRSPVQLTIKRLDQVHPQISGNKFYKLKYNFLEAQRLGYSKLLTFGGAFSNHIAATAYAAHLYGFSCTGVIRGEELATKPLNHTLQTAQNFAMQLHYISREKYRLKHTAELLQEWQYLFPEHYIIPEGGTNSLAIQGCREILSEADLQNYDYICCAAGTGGTIAGLIESSAAHQFVLGFSALKGNFLNDDVAKLTTKKNWYITDDYCFGGYARTTPELMQFIEQFEQNHAIPLEQVYTAKLMYGVFDLIQKGYFPASSSVLVIHSGGLQGKLSG